MSVQYHYISNTGQYISCLSHQEVKHLVKRTSDHVFGNKTKGSEMALRRLDQFILLKKNYV